MFVAIVTAPFCPPAPLSSLLFHDALRFKTLCFMPALVSISDSLSDFSTEIVPTSTACRRVHARYLVHNRPEFAFFRRVYDIVLVHPYHRLVGGYLHDVEVIYALEFVFFRLSAVPVMRRASCTS
jgi:hypothetical protein